MKQLIIVAAASAVLLGLPGTLFAGDIENLNGQTKIPLVINQLGGAATVTILPGVQGDISYEDGNRETLADLINSGRASASAECSGGFSLAIPAKCRIKMDFGPWTFSWP